MKAGIKVWMLQGIVRTSDHQMPHVRAQIHRKKRHLNTPEREISGQPASRQWLISPRSSSLYSTLDFGYITRFKLIYLSLYNIGLHNKNQSLSLLHAPQRFSMYTEIKGFKIYTHKHAENVFNCFFFNLRLGEGKQPQQDGGDIMMESSTDREHV